MKQAILLILLLGAGLLIAVEKIDILENEPFPLTHWLSQAEAARWEEIGRDFYETDPPDGAIHNVAEFEQMEGVLVRYPFGIPVSLIAAMSQHTKVVTIVSSTSQQNTVTSQYNSSGVNIDNCEFLIAPSDSYWTRDYGPWYVIDGNEEFGIVNFPYNRPRPNDNDIPIEVADFLEINLFGMNVVHTGGNYMTDGLGQSISTDLVYAENSISNAEVNQRMLNYLGIETYFVVADPNNTYIDHVDCWGKYLDVDKILIREVPPSHAQYDEIEAVAAYFASETSSYGNNYQVFRVNTPNDQPYTNSLILNNYVYMPITGSQYDDAAIASYEAAMPGYTVVGVTAGPAAWESTDALHCRAKGIADREMLYIYHLPLLDEQPADIDQTITAELTAYSGVGLIADEIILHYSVGGGEYTEVAMNNTEDNIWEAVIPGQPSGSIVSYYISAVDADWNQTFHPLIGETDPHVYYSGGEQDPVLEVFPEVISMEMPADTTASQSLELTNSGGGVIYYSLEFQDTSRNIEGSYVSCGSDYFSPGETIEFDFTAYNSSSDGEWITEIDIDFPEGFYVEDATDFTGGSGGDLEYLGDQGNGVTVVWFGQTINGWGVLHNDEFAICSVEVSVAPDFSGNAILGWVMTGDGYGSDPHSVSGEMELGIYDGPVSWIAASQLGGELWAQETDTIDLLFDTAGMAAGMYSCNLIISALGEEMIIPITLNVNSNPALEDDIAPVVNSAIVYPNPFNANLQRGNLILDFSLYEAVDDLEIAVYNLKGQKVADIFQGDKPAGEHQVYWNRLVSSGQEAAAGLYFFKLSSRDFKIFKKAIILK